MNAREVVLESLRGHVAPRPAVLCPGGMMSMAVVEVMEAAGAPWPLAHSDRDAMLRLALAMQEATGFDNVAMPFCMTVEAEAYGADVNLGGLESQPRIRGAVLPPDGSGGLRRPDLDSGRSAVLCAALSRARRAHPDVGLLGNLVGPFSLLGMLADPLMVLRWTRRQPELVHGYLEQLSAELARFGMRQVEAGADAVCIAEPTATGEILGGDLFRSVALPHLNCLANGLRRAGAPVIVHICGDVRRIRGELLALRADALSFDAMVDVRALAASEPPWQVMGNVSAFLLKSGPAAAIRDHVRRLAEGGIRLLAPACGVIPTTPVEHLRAMREAVGD